MNNDNQIQSPVERYPDLETTTFGISLSLIFMFMVAVGIWKDDAHFNSENFKTVILIIVLIFVLNLLINLI